jgi:hypothetical protein
LSAISLDANLWIPLAAETNKDMDQLSAKIEKPGDAVKAEAKPKLQALRNQIAELNPQLDAARNATESTGDSVKAGSNKAYAEFGLTQS